MRSNTSVSGRWLAWAARAGLPGLVMLLTSIITTIAGADPLPAPAPELNCTADAPHSLGAVYRICTPPPERWNRGLVVYAHGYVSPFEPVAIPENQLQLATVNLPKLITDLGFAFATTSYSGNGLVIPQAVEDIADLVPLFPAVTGWAAPKRVYLIGPSEGGAVTVKAMEKYGDLFDGGVSACGPIGDFRRQINYLGDFRVVFDHFFPGLIPGTATDVPMDVVDTWYTDYVPAITAAVAANPDAVRQLLRVTTAPVDATDSSSVLLTIVDLLWYNVFGSQDAKARLGGQPFDNRFRWYTGSDNDFALNRGVQRFRADDTALQAMADDFETTGEPQGPLVLMHTTLDPIMRYWNQPTYARKVRQAGFGDQIISLPIARYGHCRFEAAEALVAFALLILKVEGAELLDAEDALPTPEARTLYRQRMQQLAR